MSTVAHGGWKGQKHGAQGRNSGPNGASKGAIHLARRISLPGELETHCQPLQTEYHRSGRRLAGLHVLFSSRFFCGRKGFSNHSYFKYFMAIPLVDSLVPDFVPVVLRLNRPAQNGYVFAWMYFRFTMCFPSESETAERLIWVPLFPVLPLGRVKRAPCRFDCISSFDHHCASFPGSATVADI